MRRARKDVEGAGEHLGTSPIVLVLIALLGLTVVFSIWQIYNARVWDPIDDFPQQTILEVTDDTITVEGTKCYNEDVTVRGEFWWQSVDPAGTILATKGGTGDKRAGCETNVFENPIPEEVLAVEELRGPFVWVITGYEIPLDGSRQGLEHVWRTETFTLSP